MQRKNAVNQSNSPEQHPFYHSTKKLLYNYRDVVWHLEVASRNLQLEVRAEYGHALDDCLTTMEKAGIDLSGTKLEGYARALERSRKMLQIIDSALSVMRQRNKRGELYYWVLYYTFLSPQEFESINDILIALEAKGYNFGMRTYYTRREEAVRALSSLLWGFTSKECQALLRDFDI